MRPRDDGGVALRQDGFDRTGRTGPCFVSFYVPEFDWAELSETKS